MANFDCDVIVIGSGFGGRVAALLAVEKGYSITSGARRPVLERLDTSERTNNVQRKMLEAAARGPRDLGELAKRLQGGRF